MRARPEYLPKQSQIAKECRIIRNRWTPVETATFGRLRFGAIRDRLAAAAN